MLFSIAPARRLLHRATAAARRFAIDLITGIRLVRGYETIIMAESFIDSPSTRTHTHTETNALMTVHNQKGTRITSFSVCYAAVAEATVVTQKKIMYVDQTILEENGACGGG